VERESKSGSTRRLLAVLSFRLGKSSICQIDMRYPACITCTQGVQINMSIKATTNLSSCFLYVELIITVRETGRSFKSRMKRSACSPHVSQWLNSHVTSSPQQQLRRPSTRFEPLRHFDCENHVWTPLGNYGTTTLYTVPLQLLSSSTQLIRASRSFTARSRQLLDSLFTDSHWYGVSTFGFSVLPYWSV